jgi:Xaa-Pro aminopeptidase
VCDNLRSDIDPILAEKKADALLLYSESFKDANMYYLTKFLAPDPFILLKKLENPPTIFVKTMEFQRAKKESIVKDVRSYAEYNYFQITKTAKDPQEGEMKFIASVMEKEVGKKSLIAVPQSFPSLLMDSLRNNGLNVKPFHNLIGKARETKEPDEIDEMTAVQRIAEKATKQIIETIANCDVDPKGTLTYEKGGKKQPLTAGKLKTQIWHAFIDHGVTTEDTIVACGPKSAMPHYSGEPEDKLKANQPIIMDIFPQSLHKRYFTDMTRTVVKGKASKETKKMFDVVLETRNKVMDAIHAGALGNDMYNLCCDIFEKAGYKTTRGGKQIEKGFTHGLGHGVGLAVHEGPRMGELTKFPLKEHNIVTVEPGLYDPKIGGVRIEDIVEVTKKGCRNLTKMPIQLEI